MIAVSRLCLGLLVVAVASSGQSERASSAVKVNLCELAQHAEEYAGKLVEVRASVAGNDLWIDDFEQRPKCPSWMGVIDVLPEEVKPKVAIDAVRDDSFNEFFADLRKGMNVQATFEGRFDAVYTWTNQKRVWVAGANEKTPAFGKKGQYGGRLILHRVSQVLARPVPRR